MSQTNGPRLCDLVTPFENSENTWSIYPRPQMVRDSYIPLDKDWRLAVKSGESVTPLGGIAMPFAPETRLSGIRRTLDEGEKWVYTCNFTLPEGFNIGHVLLHFGAVDQIANVNVNGHNFKQHVGGYLPFEYDITKYLADENVITVEVADELDLDIPYGKQWKKRGGMWYTPISGIWQTVWLESVPKQYISSIRLTPTLDTITIETVGGKTKKTVEIETEKGIVTHTFEGDKCEIKIDEPHLWSPEDPYLYNFTLTSGEDKIRSYFALRTITCKKKRILLNGKPYFFNGLLVQGYFSDGIYLPASPDGFLWDIQTMKKLGFNMLRKHIKVEPEAFYYYCDKYGMVVFQDMVNSGHYSFFADTLLPNIIGHKPIRKKRFNKRHCEIFEKHCADTVNHLYNHPCICYYTLFNEGWGQYDADRIYGDMKAIDSTRVWDATSGWFAQKDSDVQSEHIYFKKAKFPFGKRPAVLSEFGGYTCKIEGHIFNLDKAFGYKTMTDIDHFSREIQDLYFTQVVPMAKKGLSAAVLTQVSDVEDEINGLVTYDRQVVKVREDVMQEIKKAIDEAFAESNK